MRKIKWCGPQCNYLKRTVWTRVPHQLNYILQWRYHWRHTLVTPIQTEQSVCPIFFLKLQTGLRNATIWPSKNHSAWPLVGRDSLWHGTVIWLVSLSENHTESICSASDQIRTASESDFQISGGRHLETMQRAPLMRGTRARWNTTAGQVPDGCWSSDRVCGRSESLCYATAAP